MKHVIARRALLERTAYLTTALAAAPLLSRCASDSASAAAKPSNAALDNPDAMPAPLQIAMLLYPGFTMLDLTGPQCSLGRVGTTHLVSSTLEPVLCDSGISLVPTTTYEDCPTNLDILFVPGGFGTADAMQDPAALKFLTDRAPTSRYVTSVCTGALVLAAAGLLDGYRAATHWAAKDALALFDIDVRDDRVVIDRNRVTGGGVTAGIDFGLRLLSVMLDEQTAKVNQLMMEYTPQPPFDAGEPETAGAEIVAIVDKTLAQPNQRLIDAARAAIARLG